jgi:hypothetical protein
MTGNSSRGWHLTSVITVETFLHIYRMSAGKWRQTQRMRLISELISVISYMRAIHIV